MASSGIVDSILKRDPCVLSKMLKYNHFHNLIRIVTTCMWGCWKCWFHTFLVLFELYLIIRKTGRWWNGSLPREPWKHHRPLGDGGRLTLRENGCETRRSHIWKVTSFTSGETHPFAYEQNPPLSFERQHNRTERTSRPRVSLFRKPFSKYLMNLSSASPLPGECCLHRHCLHVVICQQH